MPSTDGSEPSLAEPTRNQEEMARTVRRQRAMAWVEFFLHRAEATPAISPKELAAVGRGEPYCFRCGKPASSFSEYSDEWIDAETSYNSHADYVRHEEGTYNRDTNRFACDECYVAIGTPSEPDGWEAP